MKNSILILFLALSLSNLFAQENYNPNTYKYRFQKLRGFSTNYNFGSDGLVTNQKETDTLNSKNNKYNLRRGGFNLNFNGSYFKSINTENLQHFTNLNFGLNFGSGIDNIKDEYNDKFNTSSRNSKNRTNSMNYNINYNSSNRFYNNNKFKLLNYGIRTDYSYNKTKEQVRYTNSFSDTEFEQKQNSLYANASLQLGFGNGRLEFVTDPIMAAFMLKDLQAKAGIGALTNEQIEAIGKGITTIRNTRFIDFRFRLIDQLEMLDSVLQANGVKSNKASRYFTTINDNWLYATQFGRVTGKRWSFYLDNNANINNRMNDEKTNKRHTKSINRYTSIYNGIGINFDQSTQKGIYRQNAWGANFNVGLQHKTENQIFEDSIGLSSYIKKEQKRKPDQIVSNIGLYYEYLWQPNTRTFFTARVNPYLTTNLDQNGLRLSNPKNIVNNNYRYGINNDFRYFKFFNARLSTFVNVNIDIFRNSNTKREDIVLAPNPIITSNNINNNFQFNHTISAGITYVLF